MPAPRRPARSHPGCRSRPSCGGHRGPALRHLMFDVAIEKAPGAVDQQVVESESEPRPYRSEPILLGMKHRNVDAVRGNSRHIMGSLAPIEIGLQSENEVAELVIVADLAPAGETLLVLDLVGPAPRIAGVRSYIKSGPARNGERRRAGIDRTRYDIGGPGRGGGQQPKRERASDQQFMHCHRRPERVSGCIPSSAHGALAVAIGQHASLICGEITSKWHDDTRAAPRSIWT